MPFHCRMENGPRRSGQLAFPALGYSDPSSLDSYGIGADYLLLDAKVAIFGRYSDAPSDIGQRASGTNRTNYNTVEEIRYQTQEHAAGSNQAITPRVTNEIRFNYSRSRAHSFRTLDNFGGRNAPLRTRFCFRSRLYSARTQDFCVL